MPERCAEVKAHGFKIHGMIQASAFGQEDQGAALHAAYQQSNSSFSADEIMPDSPDAIFQLQNALQYTDRISLTYRVKQTYRANFILIKGFLEFHRLRNVALQYDRGNGLIECHLFAEQLPTLRKLITQIESWVKSEIQFKQALKAVIDFEKKYQTEMTTVYGMLRNVSAIA